jgi:hypothetical protein
MPIYAVVIFLLFSLSVSLCAENKPPTPEERVLKKFMNESWHEGIFETECTGLEFNAEKKILVSIYPSTHP